MSLSFNPNSVSPSAYNPSAYNPSAYNPVTGLPAGSRLIFCLFRLKAATPQLTALLLAVGSLGFGGQSAIAQVTINRDANTGAVFVDQNAFDVRTGELTNESNIPLPSELPAGTSEGVAIPTAAPGGPLAPNSLEITTDIDFIEQSFNEQLNQQQGSDALDYNLDRGSVTTRTQFALDYVPGNHAFGEGIQVTVFNADGSVKSQETRFVRGDEVVIGPDGNELPDSGNITVEYGVDEKVELRILNLRENNAAEISESGVYFTRDGQIIAEDLPDGGDRDFDDGEYVELDDSQGRGRATELETQREEVVDTERTPLDPEIRRDEVVEEEEFTTVERDEEVVREVIERGSIEVPDTLATRLGHAVGLRTDDDELLVYDRYAATGQVRAGSDGLGAIGQLRPLFKNPSAPPTLLTGSALFDPWADDNEAGFSASIGITQFLSRTHRQATDIFGNPIENPDPDGAIPLEPTGLFSNRRMVGYVPSGPSADDQILPVGGIFTLPENQRILIDPPDPQAVGRGDSAYTDNVGGFIVESASGELTFIPQWTKEGYATTGALLEPGEATRIIYALVPQQAGQNLQLGQSYAVDTSTGDYRIADGGFVIIAADQYPDNFFAETTDVYTVEDTLPTIENASTPNFNGIRGVYIEVPGGELVPTVDPAIPAEADARIGTVLFPEVIGQQPYARTTVAGGLYLGGSLTGGFGNQRDLINEVRTTTETETDQQRTTRTITTFRTPVTQVNTTSFTNVNVLAREGDASFIINSDGLLEEVKFDPTSDAELVENRRESVEESIGRELGEEVADTPIVEESVTALRSRSNVVEQDSSTRSDSYANASPINGEIALGGVLNFGNTPWTPAANLIRAELFARDTVIGRSSNGSEAGWRAELMLHPFGEVKREAYQYDEGGNVVPIYKTQPFLDADGNRVIVTETGPNGETVEIERGEFVLDEAGDRIPERVGTGKPRGPGLYVRLEDAWDDGDSAVIDGGIQFSF